MATAMLSITAPGVSFGDVQVGGTQAGARDDEFATARMVGDHKGRFGLFAVLPLPDVQGSLQEIEFALDTLKADGVGVLTSYGNTWLGDPSFTRCSRSSIAGRRWSTHTRPMRPAART